MSEYTVVRIDVDADIVRRAARVVPGVAVPDEFDPETRRVTPFPGDTDTPATEADVADDTGRVEQIRSLVGEYGLLAAGVAMVGAGVATAGLWYYRRRNRDTDSVADESFERPAWETPDSAAGPLAEGRPGRSESVPNPDGDADGATPTAFDAPTADEYDPDEHALDDTTGYEASPAQPPDAEATRDADDTPDEEPAVETPIATDEPTPDGPVAGGENGGLDRAPLLGVAFVALSGAVVRWLQRES